MAVATLPDIGAWPHCGVPDSVGDLGCRALRSKASCFPVPAVPSSAIPVALAKLGPLHPHDTAACAPTSSACRMRAWALWGIENSSHHVRDVVFAEDASTVHAGSAPRAMAVFAESGHRPAAAAGSGQHRRDHPGDPGHTRTRPLDLGASPSAHSYRELEAPCTRQSCTKTRWAPTGGPPLRRSSCSARVPRTTTTSAYTQPRAPPVQSSSTAQKERAAPPTCGGRTTADRRPRRGAHAVRVRLLTSRHSTGDGARCPRTTHGRATRFRVPEWWCKTATAGPSQRFAGTGGGPISRCQLVAGNRPARRKRAVRRGHLPEPSHAEGTGDDLPWRRHACAPAPWDDHDAVVGLQAARVVASRNRESRSQALRRAIRP